VPTLLDRGYGAQVDPTFRRARHPVAVAAIRPNDRLNLLERDRLDRRLRVFLLGRRGRVFLWFFLFWLFLLGFLFLRLLFLGLFLRLVLLGFFLLRLVLLLRWRRRLLNHRGLLGFLLVGHLDRLRLGRAGPHAERQPGEDEHREQRPEQPLPVR